MILCASAFHVMSVDYLVGPGDIPPVGSAEFAEVRVRLRFIETYRCTKTSLVLLEYSIEYYNSLQGAVVLCRG